MNVDERFERLLEALGGKMGMDLSFDEDGACNLSVGPELSLNIRRFPDEDRLTLTSVGADDLPDDVSHGVVVELLECALNPLFRAGPAVGRDPGSGTLVAWLSLQLDEVAPSDFPEIVEKFMEFVVTTSSHVAGGDVQFTQEPQMVCGSDVVVA